ncbi:Frigida domain-containing protein [Cephalotus follicularis]|uniref:FRIGIDA-like protein n=1 Tax=Cephalotus follicularis TaxID=3775 RepID=A0A1Q3B8N0_CEPFO|nr:Frigida domain-containing protein [Cephalotus follicularis]
MAKLEPDCGFEDFDLRKKNLKSSLDQLQDNASSFLLLTLQWKELEDHLDDKRTCLEKRWNQLLAVQESVREREENLHSVEQSMEAKDKELSERSKAIENAKDCFNRVVDEKMKEAEEKIQEAEEKIKGLKSREEIFEKLKQKRFEQMESREKDFREKEKEFEECCKEFRVKEMQFEISSKEVGLKDKQLFKRFKEVELKAKWYEELLNQVELRNKEVESKGVEYDELFERIELKDKQFEERFREVEARDIQLGKRFQEVESKGRKYEELCKDVELRDKELEDRARRLKLKEIYLDDQLQLKNDKFEDQCKELVLKGKQIEDRFKQLELKEKIVQEQCRELELKEKQFEERSIEFELKEKQIVERYREVELKEKRYYADTLHTQVKFETEENIPLSNAPKSANLEFCVNMDGKCLQIFLNERWKEHDFLRNEVLVALQLSSNPAQLVLDAMQGFYPPHLEKDNVHFEETVIRRSCILLLEQLMKLSPNIKANVRNEAMKLAFDWITKMRANIAYSLEVLGFLQLLATYGLAHAFDADELLNYLEIVTEHTQAPGLWHVLGFSDKISDLIQKLIVKQREVEAIKFIYAFDLVENFPPIPLLRSYLKRSRKGAIKLLNEGRKSLEQWNECINKRITALKAVIRCIEDHELESSVPLYDIRGLVDLLENKNPASNPSGFINGLIKKEQRIKAITYIYAWNMVDKFSPVQLLKDHLTFTKGFCKRKNKSIPARNVDIETEMLALIDVIECIEDYKLKSEFCPKILTQRIDQLQKKGAEKQPLPIRIRWIKAKLLVHEMEKELNAPTSVPSASSSPAVPATTSAISASSSPAVPAPTKVDTPLPTAATSLAIVHETKSLEDSGIKRSPAPDPNTKPQQECGNKRPRIVVPKIEPPHQQPAMHSYQGVSYMNAPPPPRYYSLVGYQPKNSNSNYYPYNIHTQGPWDAFGRPGYY